MKGNGKAVWDGDEQTTYAVLEGVHVRVGERVGLGDDGDEVDARPEALHDLNVERLQPTQMYSPPSASHTNSLSLSPLLSKK